MIDRFSATQVEQLRDIIATTIHAEFANVGMFVGDDEQVNAMRKDLGFLRWVREAGNRAAQKLGWLVIATLAGGVFYIAKLGVDAYLAMHGRPGGP